MDSIKDKESFFRIMATFGVIFEKNVDKEKMEAYFHLLKSYSIEQISVAAEIIGKERTTASFPKPAEIIQAIEGNPEEQALLAWHKVLEAVQTIGATYSVQFNDPKIHSVIERMWGSWIELCKMRIEDTTWYQKDFERAYKSMKGAKIHPNYLPGTVEIKNRIAGYEDHISKPIPISDDAGRELALVVKKNEVR